jgi:predicted ATPase
VIDNFEQIARRRRSVASARGGAGPVVLVTSRSALRISGEQEYPLDPLDLEDAVALFVDRAQREPTRASR